jgi:cytochrome c
MSLYELNKIAGAVLFALLILFGTRTVSNIIFTPHAPEQPGYEIEVAEEDGQTTAEPKQEAAVPLANLLQQASVEQGQRAARKCAACHTFDEGGASRVGPNLYNIVGSPLGAEQGFAYSQALKDKGGNWDYEDLDLFIEAPRAYLPGTKMAFAGISRPPERADLILYLRSLSPSPVALPEPEPEPEPATAETGEAADGAGSESAAAEGAEQKPAAGGGADQTPTAGDAGEAQPAQGGAGESQAGRAQAAENAQDSAGNQPAQSEPAAQQ